MGNRRFIKKDGITKLARSTTSAQEAVFTVPAGENWLIEQAGVGNTSQTSRSAYRYSVDGTNYTPKIISASVGGGIGAPLGDFNFILPAGGVIITTAVTFTAADTVVHFVKYMKMLALA